MGKHVGRDGDDGQNTNGQEGCTCGVCGTQYKDKAAADACAQTDLEG